MPKTIKYAKDAVVFYDEMPCENIYVLQDGKVELSVYEKDIKQYTSFEIKKGDFFGLKDVLASPFYTAKAVAKTDSIVILLSLKEFEDFIVKDHALAMRMLSSMSTQLKYTYKKLLDKYGTEEEKDPESGLIKVARGFYNGKEYQPCIDVCERFLGNYTGESQYRNEAKDLLKKAWEVVADTLVIKTPSIDDALTDFVLPDFFKRFEKTFPPNQIIFSEFENDNYFYLIRSGVVRSVKCINEVNRTISFEAPGDFFGLNGLFGENMRDVSCISTNMVEALEFTYEQLDSIIAANPKFACMLLKLLAKRINSDLMMINNMSISDLNIRIKDMLLMFDTLGFSEKISELSRKISLTAYDVSVWINIEEEKIKVVLNDLNKRGLIHLEEDYLIIDNINVLRHQHSVEIKSQI